MFQNPYNQLLWWISVIFDFWLSKTKFYVLFNLYNTTEIQWNQNKLQISTRVMLKSLFQTPLKHTDFEFYKGNHKFYQIN